MEKLYFGVESNGELYGYSEFSVSSTEKDGRLMIVLEENAYIKISALGFPVDTEMRWMYCIDPETGQFFYYNVDAVQEGFHPGKTIVIDKNMASITSKPDGKIKKITLPSDAEVIKAFRAFRAVIQGIMQILNTAK